MKEGHSLLIDQARKLGYTAFGPLILRFSTWLAAEAQREGVHKLYFLSREGYFLKSHFEKSLALGLVNAPGIESRYLLISRRAAFGAVNKTRSSLKAILEAGEFDGRLYNLLEARIGYSPEVSEKIGLPNVEVSLLDDVEKTLDILIHHLEPLNELALKEQKPMLEYLGAEGFTGGSPLGLVDLGYAGSIQRSLQSMTGNRLAGFYFATTKTVNEWQDESNRLFACFAKDCSLAKMPPVYRYALALESWMTSPQGQLTLFEMDAGKPVPKFGPVGKMQANFEISEAVAEGVERYMEDIAYLAPFDPTWEETLVSRSESIMTVALESAAFSTILNFLCVEDDFCGKGEIPIAELVATLMNDMRLSNVV